jgi:hypothetical protein
VYCRSKTHPFREERTKKFLEQHRVEEKKFADFAAAEAFFNENGFAVTRRLFGPDDPSFTRETWVLLPCG